MDDIFEKTITVLGWEEVSENYKEKGKPQFRVLIDASESRSIHQDTSREMTEVLVPKSKWAKSFLKLPMGEHKVKLKMFNFIDNRKVATSFWILELVEE